MVQLNLNELKLAPANDFISAAANFDFYWFFIQIFYFSFRNKLQILKLYTKS